MLCTLQKALNKGDIYPLLDDRYILRAANCQKTDFDLALCTLQGSLYDSWQEGSSHFALCTAGEHSFHLSFHEKTGDLHIVMDQKEHLPPLDFQQGSLSPLITQGRLLYYAYDCGMLYVIRLSDGQFVVIDGGMAEYEEPEHFLDILQAQNTKGAVPEIALWFITHAHDDHFTLLTNILTHHADQVKIGALVYNWAAPERIRYGSNLTAFNAALAAHPEIPVIAPHTGMRFACANAVFSVLYTHEDRCPDMIPNFNDTSTVMRMDADGKRVMWTGDMLWETADWMCQRYEESTLRCDFLQVAHHGYSGATDAFYRAVDARVLLWPCPDFWFYTQSILPCNQYLLESPHVKATFISGREETVIDLNAPVIPSNPYEKYQQAAPGDVLFDSDFTSLRIFDLGWAAITGGRTNYRSAALSLTADGLGMKALPDHYSVLEMMQPGMLPASFTLDMRIRLDQKGTSALFWNYETPWEYDENQALPLPLSENAWQDIRLQADCEKGEALFTAGDTTAVLPFTPANRKGLYLILKDAAVTLRSLRISR